MLRTLRNPARILFAIALGMTLLTMARAEEPIASPDVYSRYIARLPDISLPGGEDTKADIIVEFFANKRGQVGGISFAPSLRAPGAGYCPLVRRPDGTYCVQCPGEPPSCAGGTIPPGTGPYPPALETIEIYVAEQPDGLEGDGATDFSVVIANEATRQVKLVDIPNFQPDDFGQFVFDGASQ